MASQQPQTGATASSSRPVEAVLSSVLYCNVYGDERDAILARWNLLQAAWGTGKGISIFSFSLRCRIHILHDSA